MHKKIMMNGLFAGYAVQSVNAYGCSDGEKSVDLITRGFFTTEDGGAIVQKLDGLSHAMLYPAGLNNRDIASIERLLIILHRDRSVDVYINEPSMIIAVQLKKNVERLSEGELVAFDAIEHIIELEFDGIKIPNNCGFIWVFSFGWRKGYLFDLTPLGNEDGTQDITRKYELGPALADAYSYLMNQEMLNTDQETWEELFRQDWFPFLILTDGLRKKMISHAKERWPIDQMEDEIVEFMKGDMGPIRNVLLSSPNLVSHKKTVAKALEQFMEDDYISTVSVIMPRIEGLMRSLYVMRGETKRPRQDRLISSLLHSARSVYQSNSPAIPDRFAEYLERCFFREFEHDSPEARNVISRHTLMHGVIAEEHLNRKYALISIMTLMQIVSCADRISNKSAARIVI